MPKTALVIKFSKGDQIDKRFTVKERIGAGACGTVYRCQDAKTKADVAVKVLEDVNDLGRFRRECKVMRQAGDVSPHVVKVVRSGRHGGQAEYLAMEYMDGKSLTEYLNGGKKVPADEAAWIIIQAVRGLKTAKAVHRDIKPDNLLIGKNGRRSVEFVIDDIETAAIVKVSDFGLAKAPKDSTVSLTNTGAVMGTPLYMSPEQCRNTKRVSVKTDIYSLGVILYEMTCGRPPFEADNIYDVMAKHCTERPKLGRVPRKLAPVVARCLEKEAAARYQTLTQLEKALAGVAGVHRTAAVGRRGRWFFLLLVLGVLAVAGWWFFDQWWAWLLEFWEKLKST